MNLFARLLGIKERKQYLSRFYNLNLFLKWKTH